MGHRTRRLRVELQVLPAMRDAALRDRCWRAMRCAELMRGMTTCSAMPAGDERGKGWRDDPGGGGGSVWKERVRELER